MRQIELSLLLLVCLASCREKPAKEKEISMSELQQEISKRLAQEKGTFAVAFKDLSTGAELFVNEKDRFHAASTMKTPVMIEVFKQAATGKFSLDDSIVVKNEFKSIVDGSAFSLDADSDSETELYKQIGSKRTVSELVYQMIIMSSNLATNIVIDLVDAKNVTASMRELGAADIQVLRGVEDNKAYEQGLNNTTTAYDLMIIYEKIARGDVVSKPASDEMVRILSDQHFNSIIPAKLPKDVKVAHKTGNITAVQHDSGIVMLPDGRKYVIVFLSRDLENEDAAIEAMADVSRMIYDRVK